MEAFSAGIMGLLHDVQVGSDTLFWDTLNLAGPLRHYHIYLAEI